MSWLSMSIFLMMVIFVTINSAAMVHGNQTAERYLDPIAKRMGGQMLEDGKLRAAAPECRYGPGWIYWNGHCYQFTSYHEDFLKAEEICNEQNAYLADIVNKEEGDWIKNVLLLINPKDGTDYWLGGLDANKDKQLQWMTGEAMTYKNYKKDEPAGLPYLHMNFDSQFAWDTKDDANDKDNGFICKRKP